MFATSEDVFVNKFCYCQNAPVNNIDNSGAVIGTVIKKILDIIFGIAGGLAGMYLTDVLFNIIQGKKKYTML